MLRTLRPQRILRPTKPQAQIIRSFITLPGTERQSLAETRVLPYKSNDLYTIIADVDSYSSFLPYCSESRVTKWSSPDQNGQRWPSQADLRVGWGGFAETYTSRLFCVPGSVVEALGGEAVTKLSRADLEHHSATFDAPARANSIFQSLSTRWTVRPIRPRPSGQSQLEVTQDSGKDQTEVHLSIDFQFSNPLYAALSNAVAPKVAGIMIGAFEARARELLEAPQAAARASSQSA